MNDLSATFGTLDPFTPPPDAASVLRPKPAAPSPSAAPSPPVARSPAAAMLTPKTAPVEQSPVAAAPGQDPMSVFMAHARGHESSGDDTAVNKLTRATGRYQILPKTWAWIIRSHPELGLKPEDIWNGEKQDIGYRAFVNDNARELQKQRIEITPANLFMASFLGAGAAPQFIRAMQSNPDFPAAQLFHTEAQYNPSVFYHTDPRGGPIFDKPRSLGEVYQLMTKSFGGPAPKFDKPVDPQAGMKFAVSPAVETPAAGTSMPEDAAPPEIYKAFGLEPPAKETPPAEDAAPPEIYKAFGLEPPKETPAAPPIASSVFTTNADGSVIKTPKPTQTPSPTGEIIGSDGNGEPVFADPKDQAEYDKGRVAAPEGLLSGFARGYLGPATLLPNALGGGYAQKAENALEGVGDPFMQDVGNALSFINPVGGVAKAGVEGVEAAREGVEAAREGMTGLERLKKLWPSIQQGLTAGGWGGLRAGSQTHSDAPDWAGRLEDKEFGMIEDAALGGATGGALGGGLPLAGKAIGKLGGTWLGKQVSTATGSAARKAAGEAEKAAKEAEKAAEELRSNVNAETGKALTKEDRAAREAKLDQARAKKSIAESETELERLRVASEQLAERQAVREAQDRVGRQTVNPEAMADIKRAAAEAFERQAKAAEKAATEAGASVEHAKQYAAEQAGKLIDAKEAAERLTAEFRQHTPLSQVQFGAKLEKIANEIEEKYETAREKAANFSGAIESAPKGPIVKSDKIIKKLDEIDASTADDNLKAVIRSTKSKLVQKSTDAEGKETTIKGLSLEKADSLRKVLNAAIRSNDLSAVGGGQAKAAAIAHHLRSVRDLVQDAATDAHKPYGDAIKAWRDNSRGPLDEFRPGGGLKGVTAEQELSGRSALTAGRIASQILSNSRGGGDALAMMVRENPSVLNDVDRYLHTQLVGESGTNKITVDSVKRFMAKNAEIIDKVGARDVETITEAEKILHPEGVEISFEGRNYKGATRLDAARAAQRETGRSIDQIYDNAADVAPKREAARVETVTPETPLKAKFEEITARQADAERRIADSKRGVAEADAGVAANKARERALKTIASERADLAKTAQARAATAEKDLPKPAEIEKPATARAREAEKRLKQGEQTLAQERSGAVSDLAKARTRLDRAKAGRIAYNQLTEDLSKAEPGKVADLADSRMKKLNREGHITDEQYAKYTDEMKDVTTKYEAAKAAAKTAAEMKNAHEKFRTQIANVVRYAVGAAVGSAAIGAGVFHALKPREK